eukprot:1231549-Lingulodinium_polyedra.AAC.1
MGLEPPSGLPSSTMSKMSAAGQAPAASHARSSPTKAARTSSERRAKARGATLSSPRPAHGGN